VISYHIFYSYESREKERERKRRQRDEKKKAKKGREQGDYSLCHFHVIM
jgi:hypothetical protein